jgi:hypothetical protein
MWVVQPDSGAYVIVLWDVLSSSERHSPPLGIVATARSLDRFHDIIDLTCI